MSNANTLTSVTILHLQLACRFWEMAQKQDSRQAAAAYYNKAYTIIRQEMGACNHITLELQREMAR